MMVMMMMCDPTPTGLSPTRKVPEVLFAFQAGTPPCHCPLDFLTLVSRLEANDVYPLARSGPHPSQPPSFGAWSWL